MAQQNNRARQQRQLIIIFLLVLLLVVAAGFAFLNQDKEKKNAQPEIPPGQVAVPVAARNIELGERISSNMFRVSYFAPERVPVEALIKLDQFIGRYATQTIAQETVFTEQNVSEPDVRGGYSAVAKPGWRVVTIDANLLPGAIGTLRVGDHVDLMAIARADQGYNGGNNNNQPSKTQLRYEYMKGGTQPGEPPRRNTGNTNKNAIVDTQGVTASLIAENAEVLRVPSRGKDQELVVLQMAPQDAHITTLMVAAGASLRVVFRPYNDTQRITKEQSLTITTRMPKPEPDPDRVAVILGNVKNTSRPDSSRYAVAEQNPDYGKSDTFNNRTFNDAAQNRAQPIESTLRNMMQSNVYE